MTIPTNDDITNKNTINKMTINENTIYDNLKKKFNPIKIFNKQNFLTWSSKHCLEITAHTGKV